MIEGLKVTVAGTELKELCHARAKHHEEREKVYLDQLKRMDEAKIEGMNYSGGDPRQALEDKATEHKEQSGEMQFIAEHLNTSETYILDHQDLAKLGIRRSGYYR